MGRLLLLSEWEKILQLHCFMHIVQKRVPDNPPLPDISLDNIAHIPSAFQWSEYAMYALLIIWFLVLCVHTHRSICLRRYLSIIGTLFFFRCVTMSVTSLHVPGVHLEYKPVEYGGWTERMYAAAGIWLGGGMTTQGVYTCGDYFYPGHTVMFTVLNFFIIEYTSRLYFLLHMFTYFCNFYGMFLLLEGHEHYSIDVLFGF